MFRTNRVKMALRMNNVVCGCIVAEMRSPAIGMILKRAGLDFFILDMEHGSFNYETACDILVACHGLRIVPFVRVPAIDREPFQRLLDAGALGLLVPRVESRAQAEQAVDLIRYSPLGSRGVSLRRPHSGFSRPDPAEFTAEANGNVRLLLQIESRRAIDNIDCISKVPGIDVLFVGPSDLAHSYGSTPPGQVEPAIQRVIEAGRDRSIVTGIHHSDVAYITGLMQAGMRFFSVDTEVGVIISSLSKTIATLRTSAQAHAQGFGASDDHV